ncbi:hypothetical protein [Chryseobacterium hispalense]|uniref:hypothetical protein n=1 Tax=Chryseobacterium hispalense TaxID=1453492 RepID=UPI0039188200
MMKKSNFFKIACFGVLFLVVSCMNEDLLQKNEDDIQIVDATVKNGRFYFPNKESLKAAYQSLKNKSKEEIEEYIDNKGIHSLRPIITENNEEEVINEIKQRKSSLLKSSSAYAKVINGEISNEDILEDIDDMEEIVGDDVYSAMLNDGAEIQVAEDIYKYTDVGLFIVKQQEYTSLQNYLDIKNISDNMLLPTDISVKEAYIEAMPSNQLTSVTSKLLYFNALEPLDDNTGSNGGYNYPVGGSSGGSGSSSTYTPPVEPSIATIVQNLPIGTIRKPLLGNIFGTTWVADDKYESRRRVKVKFYSQNLWLVYAVGCKVKHQYKGWTGLWRKENADKLGIGVNSISWTFSHSMNMSAPAGVPKQAYWLGSNMYTSSNGISFTFQQNQNIPSLPFASNLDGVIQFITDFTGLTEEQLDKLFWENAWKQANKFLEGQNKKLNRVAFVVDSYSSTYIRYYDFSQVEDNQDVIERIFDFGIATPQFTYTFGGGTGNGISATSYSFNFMQPKATSVSMYGIAKKNGAWHGVKLVTKP